MKLKINKACDLNSISVLPPHNRRTSMMAAQQQPPRSQASQQSFSQGVSSQHNGMFSQLSQNSFDDLLTDYQRFGSQEKDNSVKRVSCLAPVSYPREESQMPISRSSANLTRRWSSAPAPDHKCHLSDELEHKLGTMETLLSRLGMILDSVQADIMQVNKGTKELTLAVEGVRQKSISQDDSLHILNRGIEEIKASLDGGFRSISAQSNDTTQQEKMHEILSAVMKLPEQIQSNVQKHSDDISKFLSGDLQAIACSLRTLNQKTLPLAILPPKVTAAGSSTQKPIPRREAEPMKVSKQAPVVPKIETGNWTTVKAEQGAFLNRYGNTCKNLKQRRFSPMARKKNVIINLDHESDEDFSCFIVDKESDNHLMDEVDEDTARILQKARRRRRKQSFKKIFLS